MPKGLGNIMKQAQKLQEKMAKMQEELSEKVVEAQAGGSMVKVKMNGKLEVLSIEIEPEVVNPDDIEMLSDLITAAINEAIRKAQETMAEEMKKITGGISIPGLF
ncbi:MAG: YbaB/EbfC family nucleoid-associated protein [Spirochaetes bacterium]|nr:YbaB/EbfC family nucleoid-associated protein [Deltaproteobacteria bacterium]RKX99888.1 MAG: YbaB/EbfC family nucleoid-associated protein [Spirochaetota bacterium]RLA90918.1 MAG: YbaB/EbfC family nucleoid-associated protein [Deltaproteobacteria bacterium]